MHLAVRLNSPSLPAQAPRRTPATLQTHCWRGGPLLGSVSPADAAAVTTATVAVALLDPSSVTELGVTAQVACAGAPLQLTVTFWLNPLRGEIVME